MIAKGNQNEKTILCQIDIFDKLDPGSEELLAQTAGNDLTSAEITDSNKSD